MNPAAELQLIDIHEAPAPPWWPPAPGWWVLALFVLLILAVAATWLWRRWKRTALRKNLKSEFDRIVTQAQEDPQSLNAGLAIFFRRLVIHRGHSLKMASATGSAWSEWLLEPATRSDASLVAVADHLVDAPYRPDAAPVDVSAARRLADIWIERVTRA